MKVFVLHFVLFKDKDRFETILLYRSFFDAEKDALSLKASHSNVDGESFDYEIFSKDVLNCSLL